MVIQWHTPYSQLATPPPHTHRHGSTRTVQAAAEDDGNMPEIGHDDGLYGTLFHNYDNIEEAMMKV